MFKKIAALSILAMSVMVHTGAQAQVALDDPNTVMTVMQFTAKDPSMKEQLKLRMVAVMQFQRDQPGFVENAIMVNVNEGRKPDFVGVGRWRSFKDWERLWLKPEFQKLAASVGEVGVINPGTYSVLK